MTTASRICEGWPDREFTSFLDAIRQADDAVNPRNSMLEAYLGIGGRPPRGLLGTSAAPSLLRSTEAAVAEEISNDYRRAREIISAEPLWLRLQEDENFRTLFNKFTEVERTLSPRLRPYGQLRLFEAVALGVLAARHPRRYADKVTREKAAKHAEEIKKLRARGVELSDYSETERLWKLLEKLVDEMKSTPRKRREDKRSGVREALDLFLNVLFPVIGPDKVSGTMLSAYAAMLGDTSEREVEKQLAVAKRDCTKRLRAAQALALAKALRKSQA